jgi:hypothetical protein
MPEGSLLSLKINLLALPTPIDLKTSQAKAGVQPIVFTQFFTGKRFAIPARIVRRFVSIPKADWRGFRAI